MKFPLFSLLCALFLFTLPALSAEDNLIRNGDFSDGSKYWFVLAYGGHQKNEVLGENLKVEAGKGLWLRVENLRKEGTPKPASVILNQRVKTLQAGETYRLRVEVRSSESGSLLVALGNPVKSGPNKFNLSGAIPVEEVNVGTRWQEKEWTFTYNEDQTLHLPEDAAHTVLQFRSGTLTDLVVRNVQLTPLKKLP